MVEVFLFVLEGSQTLGHPPLSVTRDISSLCDDNKNDDVKCIHDHGELSYMDIMELKLCQDALYHIECCDGKSNICEDDKICEIGLGSVTKGLVEEDNDVDEHVEDNGSDMGCFTTNNNIMMNKFCECYINDVMVKNMLFGAYGIWGKCSIATMGVVVGLGEGTLAM